MNTIDKIKGEGEMFIAKSNGYLTWKDAMIDGHTSNQYKNILINQVNNFIDKIDASKITISINELESEIRRAYIAGQSNVSLMEAGIERDETDDYVSNRMRILIEE
jgi:hypothetical protein